MSQSVVAYSCGSCGYPLNLSSSNRSTSEIGSSYQKSLKKGLVSFVSVDLSRFTQVDEIGCFPFTWRSYRPKTKLLCRKCGVSIGHGYGITDAGLVQVAIGCPNLMIVELQTCYDITDYGLESLSKGCHALKSLNLTACNEISDRGISAVFSNCSNISTLIITSCRHVSGVGFRGCPSALCYLEAESCMLTPEGLLAVASSGSLQCLSLHKLGSLSGLDGLGSLCLAKNLRFLNLRMCRYLTDSSVTAIASGCPLIEEWSLAVCHGVHLPGWSSIGLYCNNLRVLHVNRCRNICDEGLRALGDGCARLKALHINGCTKITRGGMVLFTIARPNVNLRVDEVMSIGPSIENLFRLE